MIRFDLILPDLISCYQLLHGVVSLSKCCSGGYSLCTREVSSYNRPCPELLPSGDGVTMVTMPIHIWLPGAAWHHRHGQESDNERTWDRILGQATAATLVTYNLSSQGWRGERTLEFLSALIATYIIGAGPGPATLWHWMLASTWILCIWGEFDREKILAQKRICQSSQAAVSLISIPLLANLLF